jgi:hypothetical protein
LGVIDSDWAGFVLTDLETLTDGLPTELVAVERDAVLGEKSLWPDVTHETSHIFFNKLRVSDAANVQDSGEHYVSLAATTLPSYLESWFPELFVHWFNFYHFYDAEWSRFQKIQWLSSSRIVGISRDAQITKACIMGIIRGYLVASNEDRIHRPEHRIHRSLRSMISQQLRSALPPDADPASDSVSTDELSGLADIGLALWPVLHWIVSHYAFEPLRRRLAAWSGDDEIMRQGAEGGMVFNESSAIENPKEFMLRIVEHYETGSQLPVSVSTALTLGLAHRHRALVRAQVATLA